MKMDSTYNLSHASPAKRKVLGDINNTADSPISPTANLKLLTKVAMSQCYDSIENCNVNIDLFVAETPPNSKRAKPQSNILNPNRQEKGVRKFKSLGFLCEKFLKLYPLDMKGNVHSHISLSDLANQLGVEKRRVYDIINVVESLQMATKVGRNCYTWTGHKKLADTLSQLRAYAEQLGLVQYVRSLQINRKLYMNLHEGEKESAESSTFEENSNIASFFRNERRIGILCQKFVMLFLVSLKEGMINLELAAQVLVGEDCQQNKTRLRRLYDIANILVSLGIISKMDLGWGWKKPVFQYVGPHLHHLDVSNDNSFLSRLVKTELDGVSSDMSEDSSEMSCKAVVTSSNLSSVTDTDHSYSLDIMKTSEKPTAVVEPAAKKRLVFTTDSGNTMVVSRTVFVTPSIVQQQSSTQSMHSKLVMSTSQDVLSKQVMTSSTQAVLPKQIIASSSTQALLPKQVIASSSTQTALPKQIIVSSSTQSALPKQSIKPTPTVVRVLGQGCIPQPITNGGVYKAVKNGNDIQLIRIDSC